MLFVNGRSPAEHLRLCIFAAHHRNELPSSCAYITWSTGQNGLNSDVVRLRADGFSATQRTKAMAANRNAT